MILIAGVMLHKGCSRQWNDTVIERREVRNVIMEESDVVVSVAKYVTKCRAKPSTDTPGYSAKGRLVPVSYSNAVEQKGRNHQDAGRLPA